MARSAEHWTIVRSKYFTVVSAASPHSAELWATQLEHFRVAIGQVFPAHPERLRPVTLVIFGDEKTFAKYRPLYHGKDAPNIGGYFVATPAICAGALVTTISPSETRQRIFHEATHWYQSTRDNPMPVWIEEGMAELFSTFLTDDKYFMVGNTLQADVEFLREVGIPGIEQLQRTSREKIDYNEIERAGRFYAGSWLFVHWLMYGEHSPGPASIARYLELLGTAPSLEQAFTAAFGADYAGVDAQLKAYLAAGKYKLRAFPLQLDALVPIEPPRPATAAEVEVALGAAALGGRDAKTALPHLERATTLDPRLVSGWELLGAVRLAAGEVPAARAAYDQAAKLGSRLSVVWMERARLRLAADFPSGLDLAATNTATAAPYAADYRQAIEVDAACEAAYEGLASAILSLDPFDSADLRRLEQGAAQFPDNSIIAAGCAAARLHTDQAARGEADLHALMAHGSLPPRAERIATLALESVKH